MKEQSSTEEVSTIWLCTLEQCVALMIEYNIIYFDQVT